MVERHVSRVYVSGYIRMGLYHKIEARPIASVTKVRGLLMEISLKT